MASVRDSMGNPWWVDMYNRYNYHDPSNAHYGYFPASGMNQPLVIESNSNVSIQLSRHCNGVCTYDIGFVSPSAEGRGINECSDTTGAPYMCAKGYLGPSKNFKGSAKYDRIG
jgi:hypothetical protein